MNILAIDTASRTCSVAVCRDALTLAEITDAGGETHSRHLMTMVDRALRMSVGGIGKIDALAVSRGPGSFTGVRIGISTAKGLAAAAGIPLAGVSSLEALAWQAAPTARVVCAMLDARRQEVYWQRFCFEDRRLAALVPAAVSAPEVAVDGLTDPCVLIGDGALAYEARLRERMGADFRMAPDFQHAIRAGVIAHIARERLAQAANDLATLVPAYIRPSYAKEPVDKPGLNR